MQVLLAHTFVNTVNNQEVVVYTKEAESAFVAIVHELKVRGLPLEYVWRLKGSTSRKLRGSAA